MGSLTLPLQGCASVNMMLMKEMACSGGPEPGCSLEGEMPNSLAVLPEHLTLSVFSAAKPDPSTQRFYKEDKYLFTGGLNQGLQPRSG